MKSLDHLSPDDPQLLAGLKRIVKLYGVLLALGIIVWCSFGAQNLRARDFLTFWTAARLLFAGTPELIYNPHTLYAASGWVVPGHPEQQMHWLYPPAALLLYWPLGILPFALAWPLFAGCTLWLMVRTVRCILDTPLALWAVLASPAVALNCWIGQNGMFNAAMLGFALVTLEKKPVLSGVSAALLATKLHLAPVLALMELVGRKYTALAAMILTAVMISLPVTWRFGVSLWRVWWESLPRNNAQWNPADVPYARMASVFSSAHMIDLPIQVCWALHGAVALAAVIMTLMIWCKKDAPFDLRAASVPFATLLISPYIFYYDYALTLIGLAFWFRYAARVGFLRREFLWMAIVWALPLWLATGVALPMIPLPPLGLLFVLIFLYRRASTGNTAIFR